MSKIRVSFVIEGSNEHGAKKIIKDMLHRRHTCEVKIQVEEALLIPENRNENSHTINDYIEHCRKEINSIRVRHVCKSCGYELRKYEMPHPLCNHCGTEWK